VIGCGLHGVVVDVPMTNLDAAAEFPGLGVMWPFLFVTIACGSVSGAHGLICGGTTCKQLANEKHARLIGYGGMLLEGLLAVCVVLVITAGLGFDGYLDAVWSKTAAGAPVAFAVAVGRGIWKGIGSPDGHREIIAYGTVFGIILLEGFLVTTIDTVVRLGRYLVEECLTTLLGERVPLILKNRASTTAILIAPIAVLAFSSGYRIIWPLFGASNQLLAALTLIAASVWLWRAGRNFWYTALPAAFMTVTTLAALVISLSNYLAAGPPKIGLAITATVLIALGVCVVAVTAREVLRARRLAAAAAQ
jgi:carbon starvation protein